MISDMYLSTSTPGVLYGRRALVTGGTRGLGAATARALRTAGAEVVVAARHRPAAPVAEGIGFEHFDAMADRPSDLVDRASDHLGAHPDAVIHFAGIQRRASAINFTRSDWESVLAVNLTAPFLLSQEVARRQIAVGTGGRHIFVGSLASRVGLPHMVAYNAAKAGLVGLVRALAVEWAPEDITVNAIGPGYIHTQLTDALFADPSRRDELLERIPMRRFGESDDIADPVVFLASDGARYITGQLLMADGGWTAA